MSAGPIISRTLSSALVRHRQFIAGDASARLVARVRVLPFRRHPALLRSGLAFGSPLVGLWVDLNIGWQITGQRCARFGIARLGKLSDCQPPKLIRATFWLTSRLPQVIGAMTDTFVCAVHEGDLSIIDCSEAIACGGRTIRTDARMPLSAVAPPAAPP
ncbi:MAG: hypothetical protein JWL84_5571, partial [Rhodospirillales bacterium]|nr:hypothetical protein [Rhodospirillales bacterium]